jgi:hypothetical protein
MPGVNPKDTPRLTLASSEAVEWPSMSTAWKVYREEEAHVLGRTALKRMWPVGLCSCNFTADALQRPKGREMSQGINSYGEHQFSLAMKRNNNRRWLGTAIERMSMAPIPYLWQQFLGLDTIFLDFIVKGLIVNF